MFGNLRIKATLNGVQWSLANRPSEFLLELDRNLRKEYVEVKEFIDEF